MEHIKFINPVICFTNDVLQEYKRVKT